jgi:hypothetical protein
MYADAMFRTTFGTGRNGAAGMSEPGMQDRRQVAISVSVHQLDEQLNTRSILEKYVKELQPINLINEEVNLIILRHRHFVIESRQRWGGQNEGGSCGRLRGRHL